MDTQTSEHKVLHKAKIVKNLMSVVIVYVIFALLTSLLAGDFTSETLLSVLSLVFPIIIIYWVNKKTVEGYYTARTWLIVFFLSFSYGSAKIIDNMNTYELIALVIFVAIFSYTAWLVNSICKSFEPENESTPSKRNNTLKYIVYFFFGGLLVLFLVGVIMSYFAGTLTF